LAWLAWLACTSEQRRACLLADMEKKIYTCYKTRGRARLPCQAK
jgi:hypothetical protein